MVNLVEPLCPAASLLAGSFGLGAVHVFTNGANDLFSLRFTTRILWDVARVIGQGTLGRSRLAINAPCFKGNSDFGNGCQRDARAINFNEAGQSSAQDQFGSGKAQGTNLHRLLFFMRVYKSVHPSVFFAINGFCLAALKPVGVAALGPVAFIAHANKISLIPTTLKEAAFTLARGLDVAFAPA